MLQRSNRREPIESETRRPVPQSPSCGFSFAPAATHRRRGSRPVRCTEEPWSPAELERLLASARAMPGKVGDVRSDFWWPALLLAILDTGAAPRNLLKVPLEGFDRGAGRLHVGGFVFQMHPFTVEALEALVFAGEQRTPRLFHWRRDYSLLFPALKNLVYRAALAAVTGNLFERLRVTCWRSPDILGRIDPRASCELRAGNLRIRKARDAGRQLGQKPRGALPTHQRRPDVVLIGSDSPRTLRNFLKDFYAPRRLLDCGPRGEDGHQRSINALCAFSACEVTLDQLSDDLMEEFAIWLRRANRSNATINTVIAPLLALWRYAHRKGKLDHVPRDYEKLRVPKRLPEAWSPEQVGLILKAAAQTEGSIGGVPAGDFMCGLLLTLYDTGLRVNALLSVAGDGLSNDGWLTVPADFQKQLADQAFRLHPDTLRVLAKFPPGRARLFATHWKRAYVELSRLFREILQRSGVPPGRKDGFHKLRRTNATRVADVAGDEAAQRQLGHSSVQLTRAAYIDPRQLERRCEPARQIRRPTWAPE
jgi:integrase